MAARRQALRLAAYALEQRLNADTSDDAGPKLACSCGGLAQYRGRRETSSHKSDMRPQRQGQDPGLPDPSPGLISLDPSPGPVTQPRIPDQMPLPSLSSDACSLIGSFGEHGCGRGVGSASRHAGGRRGATRGREGPSILGEDLGYIRLHLP